MPFLLTALSPYISLPFLLVSTASTTILLVVVLVLVECLWSSLFIIRCIYWAAEDTRPVSETSRY